MNRIWERLAYQLLRLEPHNRPFVFGVGLSKTGTTSLNNALTTLGYKAYHLPPLTRYADGALELEPEWWVYKYDAWTDLSTAMMFADLWDRFPNARFIYTTREKESWLRSCERHFVPELLEQRIREGDVRMLQLRLAAYGSVLFDRKLFSNAYDRHQENVLNLMQGSPRFLALNIIDGEGWDPLCTFLGKPVPDQPFPSSNKQTRPG